MTTTKSILVRLDDELADQLRLVAEAEGTSVSALVRGLIADHVKVRRADGPTRLRMAEIAERHAGLLALLADREGR